MKMIADAIVSYWGDRCDEYDPTCCICQAWAEYDRIRWMQALVAMLPHSADGVPIIPGMSLWYRSSANIFEITALGLWAETDYYSTREAALAAEGGE